MDGQRFDRLTDKQRDCLRLAGLGHQEKEIARLLDVSPGAVKERLRAARDTLGSPSSREAGRSLLAWEEKTYPSDAETYTQRVEPPQRLANAGFDGSSAPAANRAAWEKTGLGNAYLEEVRVAYDLSPPGAQSSFWSRLFPPLGRPSNELSRGDRIRTIAILAIGVALAAILFAGMLMILSRFLIELNRHGG